ncbi:MAG: hypothetical protein PVI66_16565 [Candidatus Aminicenantes bacterium]|jgi:hypothetical protein
MKNMACVMVVLFLFSMVNVLFAEEDEYFFPKENPIFTLSLPNDWDVVSSMFPNSWREWRKENVRSSGAVPLQASPDFVQEGRLLITLWAFVPDAVPDLGVAEQKAGELISERFTDFTQAAEAWEKKTINGIPFIFMDAKGKEKARNGVPVNISAAFFNPEGTHVFLILVTGSSEIFEKYKEEVQKIMASIKPGT